MQIIFGKVMNRVEFAPEKCSLTTKNTYFDTSTFRWFDRLTNRKLNDTSTSSVTATGSITEVGTKDTKISFYITALCELCGVPLVIEPVAVSKPVVIEPVVDEVSRTVEMSN